LGGFNVGGGIGEVRFADFRLVVVVVVVVGSRPWHDLTSLTNEILNQGRECLGKSSPGKR
jgi:hypothetical protein